MTIERCIECENPVERTGEEALYMDGEGPLCEKCFDYSALEAEHQEVVEKLEAEVERLKEETKLLPELTRKAERFTEIWDIATQSRSADAVQSMEATWRKWEQLRAGTHIPMEQALIMKMELAAEVERLEAHTWEQERAAVVALAAGWIDAMSPSPNEHNPSMSAKCEVLSELICIIERSEHWPEGRNNHV
jgi:hypothetical protein